MKIHAVLSLLSLGTISAVLASEHLKEPKSPLMVTMNAQEVWIPHSYGGVTAVVLDLDAVGTDEMLRVQFQEREELVPFIGKEFKIHSDETVIDEEKKSTTRVVTLIHEHPGIENYVEIIYYTVRYREARKGPDGTPWNSEETHYTLTFSAIRNDYEVTYFVPFTASIQQSDRQAYLKSIIEKAEVTTP